MDYPSGQRLERAYSDANPADKGGEEPPHEEEPDDGHRASMRKAVLVLVVMLVLLLLGLRWLSRRRSWVVACLCCGVCVSVAGSCKDGWWLLMNPTNQDMTVRPGRGGAAEAAVRHASHRCLTASSFCCWMMRQVTAATGNFGLRLPGGNPRT